MTITESRTATRSASRSSSSRPTTPTRTPHGPIPRTWSHTWPHKCRHTISNASCVETRSTYSTFPKPLTAFPKPLKAPFWRFQMPADESTTSPFVAVMRIYQIEYAAAQNFEVCKQVLAPDYVLHVGGQAISGRDE